MNTFKLIISVLVGGLTYVLMFQLLFSDLSDLFTRLKKFTYQFPLAILLDEFLDWNRSFLKKGLRILIWIPSGAVLGLIVTES